MCDPQWIEKTYTRLKDFPDKDLERVACAIDPDRKTVLKAKGAVAGDASKSVLRHRDSHDRLMEGGRLLAAMPRARRVEVVEGLVPGKGLLIEAGLDAIKHRRLQVNCENPACRFITRRRLDDARAEWLVRSRLGDEIELELRC